MVVFISGGVLDTFKVTYQGGQASAVSTLPVCHGVQASPRVSSTQSLWFEAIQMSEMQLRVCKQVNAQLPHEVSYKCLSIQVTLYYFHLYRTPYCRDLDRFSCAGLANTKQCV